MSASVPQAVRSRRAWPVAAWPWLARAWPWLGIAAAYLLTRLPRLSLLPLFGDESIYLWWGRQVLLGDLSRGWGQGKPLSGWLIALPLALGLGQIVATRLACVVVGAVGLAATLHLAATVVSPRAALAAGALWVLLPFMLFFERLATPDVLLGCLAMLSLDLAWQALHSGRLRPRLALAGGLTLILMAVAKLPVSMFFFGLPAAVLLVSPAARGRAGRANAMLLYLAPALFAAGVIAIGAYRWWAGARPIGFGFDEILLKSAANTPRGSLIINNLAALVNWTGPYLSWPLGLALLAAWVGAWFGPPLVRLLAGAAGLWLTIFVSVASFFVPRYVWPVLPGLLLVLGWGVAWVVEHLAAALAKRRQTLDPRSAGVIVGGAALVALALVTVPLIRPMLVDPSQAYLPAIDREQYIAGAGSGYGFAEAAAYLDAVLVPGGSTSQIVALAINDESRLRAYMAPRLWPTLRQVQIMGGQNQDTSQQIALLQAWLPQADATYLIVASREQWTPQWQQAFPRARLEQRFPKPGGEDEVEVRRLSAP